MMIANGRTGWYLRVLQPGVVPTAGPVEVLEQHPSAVTVAQVHEALVGEGGVDAELLELEPLAGAYKGALASRHGVL
jgi:MOSC domain-containing protein YiiM